MRIDCKNKLKYQTQKIGGRRSSAPAANKILFLLQHHQRLNVAQDYKRSQKMPIFKGCTYKKSLYYRLISLILEISPLHKISRFSVILSADQSHHFSCSRQAIVSSSNRLRIVLIGFPPTM